MYLSPDDEVFVKHCLDVYFKSLTEGLSDAPPDVRSEFLAEWRVYPSSGITEPLQALEASLPAPLPPVLRAYLTAGYFPGVEANELHLPDIFVDRPMAGIDYLLHADELWPCGYLQFGHGPCGDPLCFDINRPSADGDYPIVVFNHDIVPAEAWATRDTLEPYAKPVAPSFRSLLQTLCFSLSGPGTTAY